jgi:DNA-binding beta-propeller fold protein YncE
MSHFFKSINGRLTLVLCAGLAGCGGGAPATRQVQNLLSTARTGTAALPASGNVSFVIAIKPKPPARITPKYVSLSTRSLRILTDGATPVVINLAPLSPNCKPNPARPGTYFCTAKLKVPAGEHVFTLTAYDADSAAGNVLSTNATGPTEVLPVGVTTISVVLEGVVRHVILLLATTNPPVGRAAAIGLTAILEDADQNLIVGPYEHPVTLTSTDSLNAGLSKSILTSPADLSGITAHYTGAAVAGITFAATATDLPAAGVSAAVLAPGAPPQRLYATNATNSVSVFDPANGNAALAPLAGNGISYPAGVAVDANGKLYVANTGLTVGAGSVSVFDTAHNNTLLSVIIGSGLDLPGGAAVGAGGRLFVVNVNSVSVFDTAHGNAALPVISGGGLYLPWGVAVDANGKLYVANMGFSIGSGSVSVFDTAHGNAVLPAITGGGLLYPHGVALDASGKLYVSNNNDTISIFDTAHGNAPLPPITGGNNGYPDIPWGLAIDASGKLYVANDVGGLHGNGSISIFDTAHGNALLPVITGGGLQGPRGIAIH